MYDVGAYILELKWTILFAIDGVPTCYVSIID
jgi:hypothetical protein